LQKPNLVVVNKIDLEPEASWHQTLSKKLGKEVLLVSAKTKQGVEKLKNELPRATGPRE
jgi:50S ribosomal subunit-associated GTPase HflX